jgi:hypothetical protein
VGPIDEPAPDTQIDPQPIKILNDPASAPNTTPDTTPDTQQSPQYTDTQPAPGAADDPT